MAATRAHVSTRPTRRRRSPRVVTITIKMNVAAARCEVPERVRELARLDTAKKPGWKRNSHPMMPASERGARCRQQSGNDGTVTGH